MWYESVFDRSPPPFHSLPSPAQNLFDEAKPAAGVLARGARVGLVLAEQLTEARHRHPRLNSVLATAQQVLAEPVQIGWWKEEGGRREEGGEVNAHPPCVARWWSLILLPSRAHLFMSTLRPLATRTWAYTSMREMRCGSLLRARAKLLRAAGRWPIRHWLSPSCDRISGSRCNEFFSSCLRSCTLSGGRSGNNDSEQGEGNRVVQHTRKNSHTCAQIHTYGDSLWRRLPAAPRPTCRACRRGRI